LTWSTWRGLYLNDLLPIPYNEATLTHLVARVGQTQDLLGRRILIENPSGYLRLPETAMEEPDFLAELVRRCGCGLLLDVNNIVVGAHNLGFNPDAWLRRIPADQVGEIHLAGHRRERHGDVELLIDDHGSAVSRPVWDLYRAALSMTGPLPTLIEWDNAVPDLAVWLEEARQADLMLVPKNA